MHQRYKSGVLHDLLASATGGTAILRFLILIGVAGLACSNAAATPTVTITNATRGGSTSFLVGDDFTVSITGAAANSAITVSGTFNSSPFTPGSDGNTNGSGNATIQGWEGTPEIGTWSETWYVGGVAISPTLNFTVYANNTTNGGGYYSWHTFYPMDRGQGAYRAVNPWIYSSGGDISAQLTMGLSSSATGFPLPTTASAWSPYYSSHSPNYFLNWWCKGSYYDPTSLKCTNVGTSAGGYHELISEIPNVNGIPAIQWLALWGGTGTSAGGSGEYLYFKPSVCADAWNLIQNPSSYTYQLIFNSDVVNDKVPLLYGLPSIVNDTNGPIVGPEVCHLSFTSQTEFDNTTFANDATYQPTLDQMGTMLYDDFTNSGLHWLEAVNFLYSVPFHTATCTAPTSLAELPGGSASNAPFTINSPTLSVNACAAGSEGYYMVDATGGSYGGSPTVISNASQWNGIAAWNWANPNNNFPSPWTYDGVNYTNGTGTGSGWFSSSPTGAGSGWSSLTVPSSQFTTEASTCTVTWGNPSLSLSC